MEDEMMDEQPRSEELPAQGHRDGRRVPLRRVRAAGTRSAAAVIPDGSVLPRMDFFVDGAGL